MRTRPGLVRTTAAREPEIALLLLIRIQVNEPEISLPLQADIPILLYGVPWLLQAVS